MSSRKAEDETAELFFKVAIAAVVMIVLGIVHSLIGASKVYHLLKEPEHPKHHWLKPLFGIPVATLTLGLLVSGTDSDTGFTIIFLTIAIFWAVVHSILFNAEDLIGPTPVTARMRLETYLHPFDQELPADRSAAFVLNPQRLTPIEILPARPRKQFSWTEKPSPEVMKRRKEMLEGFKRGTDAMFGK